MGILLSDNRSLSSAMLTSPKWNIDAASPASTLGRVLNNVIKSSILPAPPDAITGTETALHSPPSPRSLHCTFLRRKLLQQLSVPYQHLLCSTTTYHKGFQKSREFLKKQKRRISATLYLYQLQSFENYISNFFAILFACIEFY